MLPYYTYTHSFSFGWFRFILISHRTRNQEAFSVDMEGMTKKHARKIECKQEPRITVRVANGVAEENRGEIGVDAHIFDWDS